VADLEQHIVDPFFTRRPKFRLPFVVWLGGIIIPVLGILVNLITSAFDVSILWGERHSYVYLFQQLISPSTLTTTSEFTIFGAAVNFVGSMLVVVITVIGVVVALATKKFTAHIAGMLVRDKYVITFALYVLLGNIWVVFCYSSISEKYYQARASVVFTCLVIISQTIMIFPFLYYLFFFLDVERVIPNVVDWGISSGVDKYLTQKKAGRKEKYQEVTNDCLEFLRDSARKAIERKDKSIASKSVDALCSFSYQYGIRKPRVYNNWFTIPTWLRVSADFLSLSAEAALAIEANKTWVEWKILRQFYDLYAVAISEMKEICYQIGMNTRYLAEAAVFRDDIHTLDLAIKYFNSYIRNGLNVNSIHTVYITLFQYRKLAEFLIRYIAALKRTGGDGKKLAELERRVLHIPKHLRYYCGVFIIRNQHFLVEMVAHDIRVMCQVALKLDVYLHESLLDVFLTVCDLYNLHDKFARGVRTAQICLATHYISAGNRYFAKKIFHEISQESEGRLVAIAKQLQNIEEKDYLEVSERGINFMYITGEQKKVLFQFLSWFESMQKYTNEELQHKMKEFIQKEKISRIEAWK
jgi:hypothetical protein